MKIIKRNGMSVEYDVHKIQNAVAKAFSATKEVSPDAVMSAAKQVSYRVEDQLQENGYAESGVTVEMIQDCVESALMDIGYTDTARAYILYRRTRETIRSVDKSLMSALDKIIHTDAKDSEEKRSNANVDGDTPMGTMLQIASAASNAFYDSELLTQEQANAHRNGDIHTHDKDFYSLTLTCCQIDFEKLSSGGFGTGHGFLREPSSIGSYAAQAAIAIQSNQNDQHGGQSIPNFDRAMAKGVTKTFKKTFIQCLTESFGDITEEADNEDAMKAYVKIAEERSGVEASLRYNGEFISELVDVLMDKESNAVMSRYDYAHLAKDALHRLVRKTHVRSIRKTDRLTFQAMEGFIHNLNTMHSRAGAQTPFSSINYGTDTSPEARMVVKNLLLTTEEGLGNGETAIFPIQIFRVKEGVNYNEVDPNYDLFKLAIRVSAKRLFPNFAFQDAPFNLEYYDPSRPETEIAYMGCRTRVMANVHDPQRSISYSRGNLSFTSINLPRIAIEAKGDEYAFYMELDRMLELVKRQLLDRFEIQARRKVRNFPFLMGQGVWLDSEKLGPDDEIREVIKHGTLSIGFIGLAETLKSLYGAHHGESEEAQAKGVAIIKHMREFCDNAGRECSLNFSLLATPAEGLSGRFTSIDKKRYGVIEGVTDREYYTNSFHVPVYYKTSFNDKIKTEAPYHALTNAGHISYVEVDGDLCQNLEAFESIVRLMKESDIGYGSVNHPVDRDPVCGYTGIIGDECPHCGRDTTQGQPIDRIRRITGYLVGTMDRWNNAKSAEERDRVKHSS